MTSWNPHFFEQSVRRIFTPGRSILDIGGGLRVDPARNNRYDAGMAWLVPLLSQVDYKIIDKVPDYNPDLVGDIHQLPLADGSFDAVVCISVLEHVEDPQRAVREIHRVLKPGGQALLYAPFLYYYHAEHGYYADYWRFTKDAWAHLCREFSSIELVPVRGAFETWIKISPLGRSKLLCKAAHEVDLLFGKMSSNQVSGYNVFLIK